MNARLETIHGVLVRVSGTGVLITGEAGAGKSDCALELIARGHSLVADDSVLIDSTGGVVTGKAPPEISGLLYIRGLGTIDVANVLGSAAITGSCRIDLCVEFVPSATYNADDLTAEFEKVKIADVYVPALRLPAAGRNAGLLIETAVKVFEMRRV